MTKPKIDITGQTFGRLTAREPTAARMRGQVAWRCDCSCGKSVLMPGSTLRAGGYKSCGCAPAGTHGKYHVSGYNSYQAMVSRCTNPKDKDFARYGEKGITVCDRWLRGAGAMLGIECFFEDMGSRPSPQHSIDRIDNRGNYEPRNCRWATPYEQTRNRSDNYVRGLSSVELCQGLDLKPSTFRQRISKGWSLEEAMLPGKLWRRHG